MAAIYSSTVTGKCVKIVPCEHCGAIYAYVCERSGYGAVSGFGLFSLLDPRTYRPGGLPEAAKQKALRALEAELDRAVDAVRCPCCSALQSPMLPQVIRRSKGLQVEKLLGPGLLGCIVTLLVAGFVGGFPEVWSRPGFWTAIASAVPGPVAVAVAAVKYWKHVPDLNNLDDQKLSIRTGEELTPSVFRAVP